MSEDERDFDSSDDTAYGCFTDEEDGQDGDFCQASEPISKVKGVDDADNALNKCIEGCAHAERVRANWNRCTGAPKEGELLQLMVVDVDHTIYDRRMNTPTLRVCGVLKDGGSAVVHVQGVVPYFWVQSCDDQLTLPDAHVFEASLRTALKRSAESSNRLRDLGIDSSNRPREPWINVTVHHRVNIQFYQFEQKTPTFRVEVESPNLISMAASACKNGLYCNGYKYTFQTFETNLPLPLRWMSDKSIVGCGWINISHWTMRSPSSCIATAGVSMEIEVDTDHVQAISTLDDPSIADDFRTLSFDIECMGDQGVFPVAERNPIIQIGNTLRCQKHGRWEQRVIFALELCQPLSGKDEVLSFEDERSMLRAWYKFYLMFDPDVLTGFNINNFDLPYIINRLIALDMEVICLGRLLDRPTKTKECNFSSNQSGTRAQMETNMQGRAQFDMYIYFQRDVNTRLPRYTLNACASHFLGDQKQDLHHTLIPVRQCQGPAGRKELATYCLKDAQLADQLMERCAALFNNIELSRVTGVTLTILMSRGQSIRVLSQIHRIIGPMGRYANLDLIIPTKEKVEDFGFQGATVIDPVRGFYEDPIVTLDFASLYPSIMMAHNLCYTTLLKKCDVARMNPSEYTRTPTGHCFVKKSTRQGILPLILTELLSARKEAKKALQMEKNKGAQADKTLERVLDGRQLALKISANSVYGFTGASVGQLPCLPIANSVTGFGREMIEATKQCVHETYCKANGYAHDSKVIYGDTDSVMIKFGPNDLDECMRLGAEAAPYITNKLFIKPIKLEFEKGYKPYILYNKKRYAGIKYEEGDTKGKFDSKGLENARRDNCDLVRETAASTLIEMLTVPKIEWKFSDAKRAVADIYMNRTEYHKIVESSNLSKEPDDYKTPPAHVQLVKRMRERDPASAPLVGSRVPYVIVSEGGKNARKRDKSEDPLYALENNLQLDADHYIKRLKDPIERLLAPVDKDGAYLSSIFASSSSRKRVVEISSKSPMNAFVTKRARCCICRTCMDPSRKAFCTNCRPEATHYRETLLDESRKAQQLLKEYEDHCRKCQQANQIEASSSTGFVECANNDCYRFYKRIEVARDAAKMQKNVDQFNLDW